MTNSLHKASLKTKRTMVIRWLESGSKNIAKEWYDRYVNEGGKYPLSYFVKKYFKK